MLLLLWLVLLWPALADAATINAASCSKADIDTAVSTASDGDTVQIPSGTCSLSGSLATITKSITLAGAGASSTTLQYAGPILYWTTKTTGHTPAGLARITGITFEALSGATACAAFWPALVSIEGNSPNIRIDHNTFLYKSGCGALITRDNTRGVIDHNTFTVTDSDITEHALVIRHDSWSDVGSNGDKSWAVADTYGSADAMIVEDNTFSCGTATTICYTTDAIYGSRGVYRFNTFNNGHIGGHGLESTGRPRSIRQYEVYRNKFPLTKPTSGSYGAVISQRGGTAMVFDNTATSAAVNLTRINDFNSYRGNPGQARIWYYPYGLCWKHTVSLTRSGTTATIIASQMIGAETGKSYFTVTGAGDANFNGTAHIVTPMSKTISTSSAANPTTITTSTAHGFTTGDKVRITGHSGSTPSLNVDTAPTSLETITVTGSNTFTIPVNVTVGGTGGTVYNTYQGTYTVADTGATSDTATLQATYDGNTDSTGYPCMDQVGRGYGDYLSGSGPATDTMSPKAWLNQALDPMVIWHNTDDGSPSSGQPSASDDIIIENRDFFNEDAACTGASCTTGVGRGTSLPTGCTPRASGRGPYYWKTDEGTWNTSTSETYSDTPGEDGRLYECTASNTWTLLYEPYTYPHPLIAQTDGNIRFSPLLNLRRAEGPMPFGRLVSYP